ncbi:MAG: AEC family transporter [Coriobacteriia bacterium]|nr:AEC family transporter [Coriobacteriia bacterium]
MSLLALAEVILTLLALVGVGYALRGAGLLTREDSIPINRIIVYAGLPALIFRAVHPARLDLGLAGVAAVAWASFLVAMGLAWLSRKGLRLPALIAGGFLLVSSLGNTGYLGYPVALTLLGDEGLVRAIFSDLFGTVAALLLVGLPIAAGMGASEERRPNMLRELVTFPGLVALAVAIALRPVAVPGPVSAGLDALANMVVPLIMISVGVSLQLQAIRPHLRALSAVATIKLLAAPLMAWGIASMAGMDEEVARLVTLQAGMPSMTLSLVIGARFGLDTDFIASAILLTTVGSVITIPMLQLLLF